MFRNIIFSCWIDPISDFLKNSVRCFSNCADGMNLSCKPMWKVLCGWVSGPFSSSLYLRGPVWVSNFPCPLWLRTGLLLVSPCTEVLALWDLSTVRGSPVHSPPRQALVFASCVLWFPERVKTETNVCCSSKRFQGENWLQFLTYLFSSHFLECCPLGIP